MDVTQVYAIVAGCLFATFTTIHFCFQLWGMARIVTLRYLVYPFVLGRHVFMGPWSRLEFLLRLAYLAANIFCGGFKVGSVVEAVTRTGTLALINMIPLFMGPHLSFLAGLLGLTLPHIHAIHGSSATVSVLLSAVHAILGLCGGNSYSLHEASHLYGLIGASSLALLLLSSPSFRRPIYEIFLRGHQSCAALSAYAVWRHIGKGSMFLWICLYVASGLFLTTSLLEVLVTCYRNFTLHRGHSQASIIVANNAIRMKIDAPRAWNIRAGQYVNIWFPWVGFRSILETHPFMIASWTVSPDSKRTMLELLIEPRNGFTRRLQYAGGRGRRLVLYSGPHGFPASMTRYGTVLMIASGFGVTALLAHCKELIRGYEACEVVTRRIHLVWQVKDLDDELAARDLIDDLLEQDTDTRGWIFQISIYYSRSSDKGIEVEEGKHLRLSHHCGTVDIGQVLTAEMTGDYVRYVHGSFERCTGKGRGDILVAVSANGELRDRSRALVEANMDQRVRFMELEYQP